tara:strand:- start:1283 stop:2458 length:1176 start_codon:yes stop_codon:yes gene_type:complete
MKLLLKLYSSLVWLKEQNIDVIILHEKNDFLDTLNLNNTDIVTIGVYPEKVNFYINWKILRQTSKFFLQKLPILFSYGIKYFLKSVYIYYIKSVINFMNPLLVITYIDNSNMFQEIIENINKRRYVAIQNSIRNEYNYKYAIQKNNIHKIKHDIFFCYGEQVKDCFESCGHSANEYIFSGGTLRLSQHIANGSILISPHEKEIFDVCIISQWIEENFLERRDVLTEEATSIADATNINLNLLNSLPNLSEIKLLICLRSGTAKERSYYLTKLDRAKNIFFEMDSYAGIDKSKVIVGISSTLLIEAFSIKKRVLWSNPLNHKYHKVVNSDDFYINSTSESLFADKLMKLISLSNIEFEKKALKLRRYLSDLNLYNLPTNKLKQLITKRNIED